MNDQPHYFSRIRLKSDSPDLTALARLATQDLYREHRLVWRFFPDAADARRDFLYRREVGAPAGEGGGTAPLSYYLVSRRPPRANPAQWDIQTREYAPRLAIGDRLEFSLRANPVSRSKKPRDPAADTAYRARREAEGKPIPRDTRLRKRDDVMKLTVQHLRDTYGPAWKEQFQRVELANESGRAWLDSQGKRLGFAIEDAAVQAYRYESFTPRRGETVEVGSMDFSGVLRVTDPEAFRAALLTGIGPAKAFGCGLLLVRRG